MAQQTAFLNSAATGYNKDFHHTALHNYLLAETGVMFSDFATKPEFKLGNGTIDAGSCVVKCIRTTGVFAGEEILALFKSTVQEPIDVTGNKKIYIEIPEGFVNDGTTITDVLTGGVNDGVGIIKSTVNYPSHTNYVPLWEITGGDWANAVDARPDIKRFGKENTISYFDADGKEQSIALDSASVNKFLTSNGPGIAPSFNDVGSTVEVSNFKKKFTAAEDILPLSMFRLESRSVTADATDALILGYDASNQRRQINAILSGDDFSEIKLNLKATGGPADDIDVKLETVDASGNATGTMIDVDAYGTITPGAVMGEVTVTLNGTISGLAAGTKIAVVLSRSGGLSTTNYFEVGTESADTVVWTERVYDGSNRTIDTGSKGYVSSVGLMDDAAIQSKATTNFLSQSYGYCEAGASAGSLFTGIFKGIFDSTVAIGGADIYVSDTGVLSLTAGTVSKVIAEGVVDGVARLILNGGAGGGAGSYEIIISETDGKDAVIDAINDGYRRIFIKKGRYNITTGITLGVMEGLILHGDGDAWLDLSYDGIKSISSEETIFNFNFGTSRTYETANGSIISPEITFSMLGVHVTGYVEVAGYCPLNLYEVTGFPPEYSGNNQVKSHFNVFIKSHFIVKTKSDGTANSTLMLNTKKSYGASAYDQYGDIGNLEMSITGDGGTDTVDRLYINTGNQFGGESQIHYHDMKLDIDSNDYNNASGTANVYFATYASNNVFAHDIKITSRGGEWTAGSFIHSYPYSRIQLYQIDGLELDVLENPALVKLSGCRNVRVSNVHNISSFYDTDNVADDTPYWASSTSYSVGDVVIHGDDFYSCVVAHTSTSDWRDDYYTSHYRALVPVSVTATHGLVGGYLSTSNQSIIKYEASGASDGTEIYRGIRTSGSKALWFMRGSNNGGMLYEGNSHIMAYGQSGKDRRFILQGNKISFVNNVADVTIGSGTMQIRPKGDEILVVGNRLHMNGTPATIVNVGTPSDVLTANNLLT